METRAKKYIYKISKKPGFKKIGTSATQLLNDFGGKLF